MRELVHSCVGRKKRQHILATPLGTKDLVFTTIPENAGKMGSTTEIDKDNIIVASMEDLREEQRNIAALLSAPRKRNKEYTTMFPTSLVDHNPVC